MSPRTPISVLLTLLLAACDKGGPPGANGGGGGGGTQVPQTIGAPAITFAEREYDFGNVLDTRKYTATLQFTNTGDQELEITGVRTSCQCATARASEWKVAPGVTADLIVDYEPTGIGGRMINIFVETNIPLQGNPRSVTQVVVSSFVEPIVIFDPVNVDLGILEFGIPHTAQLIVRCADGDFEIVDVSTTNPKITGTIADPGTNVPGAERPGRGIVTLSIDRTMEWGFFHHYVMVTFAAADEPGGERKAHTKRVPIRACLFGDLQTDSHRLIIGVVPIGDTFTKTIRLERRSGAPFTIISADVATSTVPDLQVAVQEYGARWVIELSGVPMGPAGPIEGEILVRTDAPGEERIKIDFSGAQR